MFCTTSLKLYANIFFFFGFDFDALPRKLRDATESCFVTLINFWPVAPTPLKFETI